MPFPTYHLAAGVALHAAAPKRISYLAIFAANGLIDVESGFNIVTNRYPLHAFFHTYVGATLVILAMAALFLLARWFAQRFWLPNPFRWRELSLSQVAAGAAMGAYSHVVLDSVYHADIRPLAPFSRANVLYDLVPAAELEVLCVALGLAGVVVLAARWLWSNLAKARS